MPVAVTASVTVPLTAPGPESLYPAPGAVTASLPASVAGTEALPCLCRWCARGVPGTEALPALVLPRLEALV